jgi:hypothetical protein
MVEPDDLRGGTHLKENGLLISDYLETDNFLVSSSRIGEFKSMLLTEFIR